MKPDALFTNPRVSPFVECPSCKRLIECNATTCPHCREEIDPQYAAVSKMIVVFNTAACSSANTIKTAEYGAILVFLASAVGFWIDPTLVIVNLLTPVMSIAAIALWFYRFGRFTLGDDDYARARRDMRNSLKLWVILIGVQALTLVYLLKIRK